MATSEVEFTIRARDEATPVFKRIRREARRTQFALMHQWMLIGFWAVLLVVLGAGLGLTAAIILGI